jgi:hypothetical protein
MEVFGRADVVVAKGLDDVATVATSRAKPANELLIKTTNLPDESKVFEK